MNLTYKLTTASILALSITALTSLVIVPTASATDHEAQCFEDVQGKIPWNDEKNLNWDAENVKQLCKGTTNPSEPGKCFLTVRSGKVDWGKGNEWEWKNIINLCAGTNDAQKSVDCFNKGISSGVDWRDVILMCQRTDNSQSKSNEYMK